MRKRKAKKEKSARIRDIARAERLYGEKFTRAERRLMAPILGKLPERRAQRLDIDLPNNLQPACIFKPTFDEKKSRLESDGFSGPVSLVPTLPVSETDIAYSPVWALSRWIRDGSLTSTDLTDIYLRRLKMHGEKLECVVSLMEDHARIQAEKMDAEIASGHYRGPLHGIPWGAKDLLDTAGVPTTWGAAPYRERIPETNAAVVHLLEKAGAVLTAKLTLGALAYGDIWFGGMTRNPWNINQGSSGSSAGSAAAVAAGLVGFAIGSETLGSIVSPSMRCGTVGLRPTFGRVSRSGAMSLCWSLDKLGPICRNPHDAALVLSHINGYDPQDPGSVAVPFGYGGGGPGFEGLVIGYEPAWVENPDFREYSMKSLDALNTSGCTLKEISLPDWPYDSLMAIVDVEAAAAFEDLTLSGMDDQLTSQDAAAWPNTFRRARMLPAVELIQADRFRRKVMNMMDDVFEEVDLMMSPGYTGPLLTITNFTGHPSLTITGGYRGEKEDEPETPQGLNLWGRPFEEAVLCRVGSYLEACLGTEGRRPPSFR